MRLRYLSILVLLLVGIARPFHLSPAVAAPKSVCVDAGHGGTDAGTTNGSLREKDLNLDIALRLGTLLTNAGYGVVYTRTGDQTLSNTDRAKICNAAGATIL